MVAVISQDLGFELPVYDLPESQVVWSKRQLSSAHRFEADTMVRLARVRALGHETLKSALQAADTTFKAVAERCGAHVLPHAWGLLKSRFDPYYTDGVWRSDPQPHPPLIPEGFVLVAEVPVLRKVRDPAFAERCRIQEVINDMKISGPTADGAENLRWGDASSCQFVNADLPPEAPGSLWLADIEPIDV